MVKIDFYNNKRFGPFGIISQNEYNSLTEEQRQVVNQYGCKRRSEELREFLEELDLFEESSRGSNIRVG
ncbi:hypothetical protein GOV13_04130 [Candidatus Pacearchaeota archaeon]|nr:hypothetical protein [Candidatus Pacearchaeota archaeon]